MMAKELRQGKKGKDVVGQIKAATSVRLLRSMAALLAMSMMFRVELLNRLRKQLLARSA
jgi:hypothetical protein